MAHRTASFDLKGGLDTESSDLEVNPGTVRASSNYYALSEGGYELTAGYQEWQGASLYADVESLQIVSVDRTTANMESRVDVENLTASLSGAMFNILGNIEYNSSLYVAIELLDTRQRIREGDVIYVQGPAISSVIDSDIIIDDTAYELMLDSIYTNTVGDYANGYTSDGPVKLIHGHGEDVYVAIELGTGGPDTAYLYKATNDITPNGSLSVMLSLKPGSSGGTWEAISYKFHGQDNGFFMVNGIGPAMFYNTDNPLDPNVGNDFLLGLVTIPTGSAVDTPTHLTIFKDHLVLALPGGSVQISALNDPFDFSSLAGATEILVEGEVTGFKILPGNSLGIWTEDGIWVMSGTSRADFSLEQYSDEMGALAGTLQNMPTAIFVDRRGIKTMYQSQRYGDFENNTLSHGFNTLVQQMMKQRLMSDVNRNKSQYRLFNENGRGLYLTFNNNTLAGAMEINLNQNITCVGSRQRADHRDEMFFGTKEGKLYRMDYGPSFDGEPIDAWIELSPFHAGKTRQRKQWRIAAIGMKGDPRTELSGRLNIENGHPFNPDNVVKDLQIDSGAQEYTDPNPSFSWDMSPVIEGEMYLDGTGTNASLILRSSARQFKHVLYDVTYHYTPRSEKR